MNEYVRVEKSLDKPVLLKRLEEDEKLMDKTEATIEQHEFFYVQPAKAKFVKKEVEELKKVL